MMFLRILGCCGILLTLSISAFGGDPGILFVENKAQWPAEFRFGAAFQSARLFVSDRRMYFVQLTQDPDGTKGPVPLRTDFKEVDHSHQGYTALTTFEISFHGANVPSVKGRGVQPTLYNYYLGNDRSRWAGGARSYEGVVYENLYEGIDLHIYSEGAFPKSDWIVSPCADAGKIKLEYNGMDDIVLDEGRLRVTTCLGTLVEDVPVAYQLVNGEKRMISCRYVLTGSSVSFDFPDGYDPNYELVIDPILIFSTYSGSTDDNWGNTATPDSEGNLYSGGMVSGNLSSSGFPDTPGAYQQTHGGGVWDVGILKYDSVGATLLYVTYLGGSRVETPQSLVVNSKDELLILGATDSPNFPGTAPESFRGGVAAQPLNGITYNAGTDIFIARLSPTGTQLLSATYLGGTANDAINFVSGQMAPNQVKVESPLARNYGDQLRGDVTVDADDNVLIASNTRSADFPVVSSDPAAMFHGGTHDGVVVKLTPDLSTVLWSRLVGGSLADVAYSIKVGRDGRLYVAGGTASSDIQGMNGLRTTAPGNIDGWICELAPDGSAILNGTYLGTAAYDQIYFIDISTQGDVLAYGQTRGAYPIHPIDKVFSNPGGGQFLHKLDDMLKTTEFSTVFGSGGFNPNISPTAFLVNDCNNIYMAGWGGQINEPNYFPNLTTTFVGGNTNGLPITSDAHQPVTVSGNDFYLMVLTGDAQLVYATYLGGTISLTHVDGGTSRFDKRGIVYHAVCASCGFSADFPTTPNIPANRRVNLGRNANGQIRCNNAAFKFDLSSLKAKIQTNNITLSSPGINRVCMPDPAVFENKSIGGERFEWDLGDGSKVTKLDPDTIRHFYKEPGTYVVKLKTIDVSTCIGIDSTLAIVTVTRPAMKAGEDQSICTGTSVRVDAAGAVTYSWKGEQSGFSSTERSPLVSPTADERYFVTMTDAVGCTRKDTVAVTVVPDMDLQYELEKFYDCVTRPYIEVTDLTELKEGETTYFDYGDGTTGTGEEQVHNYEKDGVYTVKLVGVKEECVYETGEDVAIVTIKIPNVITPGDSPDKNDAFRVTFGESPVAAATLDMSLVIVDKWGVQVYSASPYHDDWSASDVGAGVYYYELDITGYPTCKGWVHVIK
jgi:hypothetical protein